MNTVGNISEQKGVKRGMARDVRVAFKISEEKKQELEEFANEYGVTMSSLCSLIIGQWLYQQKKVVNPLLQNMAQMMGNQFIEANKNQDENS